MDEEITEELFTLNNRQETRNLLIGKGVKIGTQFLERLRPLQNTFNIFTWNELPEDFNEDTEADITNSERLFRGWVRSTCKIHHQAVQQKDQTQLAYTCPMLAKFLVEECYEFDLKDDASELQILGKRSHEVAYGDCDLDQIRECTPPIRTKPYKSMKKQIDIDYEQFSETT